MRLQIIVLILFTSIFSWGQGITEEVKVINDLLPHILVREWPGNQNPDSLRPKCNNDIYNFIIQDSTKKDCDFLFINDTLISLKKVLRSKKWLVSGERYTPMYLKIKREAKISKLKTKVIDTDSLFNIWVYNKLDSLPTDEWAAYTKVQFSRVCFNKEKTMCFFYVEVLNSGNTGYVTLILAEKFQDCPTWNLINGSYYK
jgi:hypothetical protein